MFALVGGRAFVAMRAEDLVQVQNMWSDWSLNLGPEENADKTVIFHKKIGGKREF